MRQVGVETIIKASAEYHGVTAQDIWDYKRTRSVSDARAAAVYIAREIEGHTYVEMANGFRRTHPTMITTFKRIRENYRKNLALRHDVDQVLLLVQRDRYSSLIDEFQKRRKELIDRIR